jgi:hypothetical protein
MVKEAVMTRNQNSHKPLVTDLWLLVDEEQTMHFGMRQAWRWSEAEMPAPRRPAPHPPVCCQGGQ